MIAALTIAAVAAVTVAAGWAGYAGARRSESSALPAGDASGSPADEPLDPGPPPPEVLNQSAAYSSATMTRGGVGGASVMTRGGSTTTRQAASESEYDEAARAAVAGLGPKTDENTPGHRSAINPWKVQNTIGQAVGALLSVIPVTAPAGLAASAIHGRLAKLMPGKLWIPKGIPHGQAVKLAWNPVNAFGYVQAHKSNARILAGRA